MISPTVLLGHAHAMPCLPSQIGLWHPLAQAVPPSGVIHRTWDAVGVYSLYVVVAGCVVVAWCWSWVLKRDREERLDMRTALEWERETGTAVLGYEAWTREGLSPGDLITQSDFERLCAGSSTVRRDNRHAMEESR